MPLSSTAGAASRRDRPSGIVTSNVLTTRTFGPCMQRVDRRAVGHVAAQHVVAGAQLAAAQRQRGVELEEARVGDHALALEQLADAAGVGARPGSARRRRPPARRSSWNGWKVALMTYSAAPMNAQREQRDAGAGTSARGLGELGGSVGRPGPADPLGARGAAHRRPLGDRGAARRAAAARARGSRVADRARRSARRRLVGARRARARRAARPAPRRRAALLWCPCAHLQRPARAPRLAAAGGTAGRPRPSRR